MRRTLVEGDIFIRNRDFALFLENAGQGRAAL